MKKAKPKELQKLSFDERFIADVLHNPIYTGVGPYERTVKDEVWIKCAVMAIEEFGVEAFLRDMLDLLRESLRGTKACPPPSDDVRTEAADTLADRVRETIGRFLKKKPLTATEIMVALYQNCEMARECGRLLS